MEREALYYEKRGDKLLCRLCPHECLITDGHTGFCGVRRNEGGTLIAQNYGKITALHDDPVEKKPLRHFISGTRTFSIGSFGCNLACPFCQNHGISKGRPPFREMTPEEVVTAALECGAPSVSYTYSEPGMFYEFMLDTAQLARQSGLKNILVTNGYLCPEPFDALLSLIDALNIDLKTFDDGIYRKVLKGSLQPVMRNIGAAARRGHVEVTMLIVPGVSDNLDDIARAAEALGSIDANLPLHISRYFPRYRYTEPPTNLDTLQQAYETCRKHLRRVYLGNV